MKEVFKSKTWLGLAALLVAAVAYAATTDTEVSRLKLNHPDLGHDGGSALHTKVRNAWTKIGDNMDSRFFTGSAVADSTLTAFDHNFGVAFSELTVLIYTGSHPNLTRVADPAAAGWVIAATTGSEKTSIDVTTPGSGGPHTFAVVVIQGSAVETLDDLDDVDISTVAPEDGQALVYDAVGGEWIAGASGDSSLKCQSVSDPNVVLKSGYVILDDGQELEVASDLTVSLTTILGSAPVDGTAYYLYVDLDNAPAAALLANGRSVRTLSLASHFSLQTALPSSVNQTRYVPLCLVRSADTGNAWSGTGSDFATLATRRHGRPVVNVSPTVYQLDKQTVGSVGSAGQLQAGHVLDSNSFGSSIAAADIVYFNLGANLNDNSGNGKNLTNIGTTPFTGTDILGNASSTLDCNGTSQGAYSNDAYFLDEIDGGVFTYGGWFKADDWTAGSPDFLVGHQQSAGTPFLTRIFDNGGASNNLVFSYSNTSADIAYDASQFTNGTWHHLVLRGKGTSFDAWVDGVKIGESTGLTFPSAPYTNAYFSLCTVNLSTTPTWQLHWAGEVDEFFFVQEELSDDDIEKLYSYRIDHNKNVAVDNQQWYGTFHKSVDEIVNELDQGWLVSKNANSAYVNFGLPAADSISLKMQNQSFNTTVVPIKTFTTGKVTSAPSFPLSHGLGCRPKDFYVLTEGQSVAGDDDKRYDLCSADATSLNCDLSSLTIDASHPVEVVASCAPIAAVVDFTTDSQLLLQQQASSGDVYVGSGQSYYKPDQTIASGTTYTVDGKWNTVGPIAGAGTVAGSGSLAALDAGQNGDSLGDVTIENLTVNGSLNKIDPLNLTREEATKLGLFSYFHGQTYNNGVTLDISPTVTANLTLEYGELVPYQNSQGDWFMKGRLHFQWSSFTGAGFGLDFLSQNVSFAFPNQTLTCLAAGSTPFTCTGNTENNGDGMDVYFPALSAASLAVQIYGDWRLNGKPSWAY